MYLSSIYRKSNFGPRLCESKSQAQKKYQFSRVSKRDLLYYFISLNGSTYIIHIFRYQRSLIFFYILGASSPSRNVRYCPHLIISFPILQILIDNNDLVELAPYTFTNLANLSMVNLTNNKLTKFPLNSLTLDTSKTLSSADFRLDTIKTNSK